MNGPLFDTTMIHGRFQPFHVGHLDYLVRALAVTKSRLIVGITNPTPDLITEEDSDRHRHLRSANPFTYFQRYSMIYKTLESEPVLQGRTVAVLIVPFPIHHETLWDFFAPKDAVQVLSVFEPWDEEKEIRFQRHGYHTYRLNCSRVTSGTAVRDAQSRDADVAGEVPAGTLQVLTNLRHYGG